MGRKERNARKRELLEKEFNEAELAELEAQAGLPPNWGQFDENDRFVAAGDLPDDADDGELLSGAPRFLRTPDVARIFRVHEKTIETWRRRDRLPCLKVGGSVRFDLSDVLRWASARKEGV